MYDNQNTIDIFKLSVENGHLNNMKHALGGSHNSTGDINALGVYRPATSRLVLYTVTVHKHSCSFEIGNELSNTLVNIKLNYFKKIDLFHLGPEVILDQEV